MGLRAKLSGFPAEVWIDLYGLRSLEEMNPEVMTYDIPQTVNWIACPFRSRPLNVLSPAFPPSHSFADMI